MKDKLNEKEQLVLDAIEEFVITNGYSPTIRELVELTGFKSPSSVHDYLFRLMCKDYITYEKGKNRTIKIINNPMFCPTCGRSL